ncbi:hypothetical protein AYO47_06390 [Planctomyces sp. SCGC AG-212-M04]|nr:hypothetical protein AYO47_06390 [Planctomyces sp. SCGC AG-212-M04]
MTRLTVCFVALLLTSTTPAWAQYPNPVNPSGNRALNAALNDARQQQQQAQQLQKAQLELAVREKQMMAEASGEVSSAKIAHRSALKDLKAAREKAEDSVEQSLGLKAALEEVSKAQSAYRELSEPLLHTLKASKEFKEAEKKTTAAKEAMKRVQSDSSLDDQTRKSRVADLIAETMATSNLERLTLRKDEKVNAARERLEAAQQKVAELRKQAAAKAESDPGVAAAQASVKSAQESVKAAEAKLASVRSGEAVTQQMLSGDGAQGAKDKGKANAKK